jgi:hypothetical protein
LNETVADTEEEEEAEEEVAAPAAPFLVEFFIAA